MTITINYKTILAVAGIVLFLLARNALFKKEEHTVNKAATLQAAFLPTPDRAAKELHRQIPSQFASGPSGLWKPGEYSRVSGPNPGVLSLMKGNKIISAPISGIEPVDCGNSQGGACVMFPSGEMVVLTPSLQAFFNRM